MSESESKKLKVGDKVIWEDDEGDIGQVIEVGYNAVKIRWDIGQVGVVDHRDMGKINRIRRL